jgi:hypothetical protein
VAKRFFCALKYERLSGGMADGDVLAVEVNRFREINNALRPHQAFGDRTPRQAYLNGSGPKSDQLLDAGTKCTASRAPHADGRMSPLWQQAPCGTGWFVHRYAKQDS